ncbi:MAG: hypothetical protein ACTIJ6_01725 [Leucobacter sp.]
MITGCNSAGPSGFDSIDELQQAFVDAGATCEDWQLGSQTGNWSAFGNCDVTGATLSIYDSTEDRNRMLEQLQSGTSLHSKAFVGSNWIITTDTDLSIAEEMGGKVIGL